MYKWNLRDFEKKLPSKEFIENAHNALLYERDSEDGITRLRLREGKYKKLIEEILPISVFLICFERIGLDLYCKYFSGNQNFDAKIYCKGLLVKNKLLKVNTFWKFP